MPETFRLSYVCCHSTSLHEEILLINYCDIFQNQVTEIVILDFVPVTQILHHCYVLSPILILLIFPSLEKGQSLQGHSLGVSTTLLKQHVYNSHGCGKITTSNKAWKTMMHMNLCQQKGLGCAIQGWNAPWHLKVYLRENGTAYHYQHHCINLTVNLWFYVNSSEVAPKSSISMEKKFHLS